MKKILFSIFCFTSFVLEAVHFQSIIAVTSINKSNGVETQEYLAEIQIKKVIDQHSELIASPKMLCYPGRLSRFFLESEDKSDIISVQVFISQDEVQKDVQTSIFVKENNQVVLSLEHTNKLNDI